jgi:hypothetical protein
MGWAAGVQFLAGGRDSSLLYNVETSGPPSIFTKGARGSFLEGKAAGA